MQVPPANAALVLREVLWDPCAGAYTYQFANWAEGLGFVLWDMVPASEWQNQPMLYSVGRMGGVSRLLRHCSHLTFRLRIQARGRRSIYEYDWYGMVTSFRLPVGTPPQPHRGAFPSTAPEAPLAQSPVVSPTPTAAARGRRGTYEYDWGLPAPATSRGDAVPVGGGRFRQRGGYACMRVRSLYRLACTHQSNGIQRQVLDGRSTRRPINSHYHGPASSRAEPNGRECRPPCIAESSDNNNNYFDYFYTSVYEYDWFAG